MKHKSYCSYAIFYYCFAGYTRPHNQTSSTPAAGSPASEYKPFSTEVRVRPAEAAANTSTASRQQEESSGCQRKNQSGAASTAVHKGSASKGHGRGSTSIYTYTT